MKLNILQRSLDRMLGRPSLLAVEPALESVYRDLFVRDLYSAGESDDYYPTGGAANYSLLYLIQRIARDLHPRSVLDIGGGQSSILWDRLAMRHLIDKVTTLEHDANWGAAIGAKVNHEVLVTPLRSMAIDHHKIHTYDWAAVRKRGPFDVIVCDGPQGTRRFSRFGILQMLDDTLPSDFILILDDAERAGEQDTIAAIHRRLQKLACPYQATTLRAAKSQVVFATGKYRKICYV